jgi:hypothetical protein
MADEQQSEVQRWTAKRRATLVISVLRGETTAAEVGAVCSNPARTDLDGGRWVTHVPTATKSLGERAGHSAAVVR